MPAGRPSAFNTNTANEICRLLSEGKSLRQICEREDMPARSTVNKWLAELDAFSDQYARARERQADFYADEIIDIADTAEDAAKARLQVDARKWVAAKLLPKKYGDKNTTDLNIGAQDSLKQVLEQVADRGRSG